MATPPHLCISTPVPDVAHDRPATRRGDEVARPARTSAPPVGWERYANAGPDCYWIVAAPSRRTA
jgi:hypothetical protein